MDGLDGRIDWILLAVLITKTVEDTSLSAWRAEKLAQRVGTTCISDANFLKDIGCLGDCWVQSNFLACT